MRLIIQGLNVFVTRHPQDGYVTIESESDITLIAPGGVTVAASAGVRIIGDLRVKGNILASGRISEAVDQV